VEFTLCAGSGLLSLASTCVENRSPSCTSRHTQACHRRQQQEQQQQQQEEQHLDVIITPYILRRSLALPCNTHHLTPQTSINISPLDPYLPLWQQQGGGGAQCRPGPSRARPRLQLRITCHVSCASYVTRNACMSRVTHASRVTRHLQQRRFVFGRICSKRVIKGALCSWAWGCRGVEV